MGNFRPNLYTLFATITEFLSSAEMTAKIESHFESSEPELWLRCHVKVIL